MSEGINHNQVKKDPFSFQYGYHYYEPKVYDLNTYYGGFNLRQLKRVMFIFSRFAWSFQCYQQLLGNKEREDRTISEDEKIALKTYHHVYDLILKITEGLGEFQNTSETRYHKQSDIFSRHSDTGLDNSRSCMKDANQLKNIKWVREKKDNRWEKEQYFPKDTQHIQGMNDSLGCFYSWGYWLVYFQEALLENGCENGDGSDDFDVTLFRDLFRSGLQLHRDLSKLSYFDGARVSPTKKSAYYS